MTTRRTIVRIYDTVDAMIAAGDAACEKRGIHGTWFIGREIADWNDAMTKARELWAEGLDTIRELANEAQASVNVKPISRKRRATWSEDGGEELDLDRLRSGQAAWLECRRQSVTAPQQVTLVVDVSTAARVNHRQIIWRGAAALVVADLLEAAGFNVEIIAVNYCRKGFANGKDYFVGYRIKRVDQPLDMATLVNAISGWFYRTIVFQSYHAEKVVPSDGLGRPTMLTAENVLEHLKLTTPPVIIANVWNQHDAAQLVRRVVDSFQAV